MLDEPTAGLDAEAEHALLARYAAAARPGAAATGAVTVLASLVAARGRYSELFGLQAAGYR